MIVLAIDTATEHILAVVCRNDKILGYERVRFALAKPVPLASLVRTVLKKTRCSLATVDCIAVDRGPGSFTGLRIGIATAMALSMARTTPVVGLRSVDVIARNALHHTPLTVLMDARKEKVYAATYHGAKRFAKPRLIHHQDFARGISRAAPRYGAMYFTGDGIKKYQEEIKAAIGAKARFLKETSWYPTPAALAAAAYEACVKKSYVKDVRTLLPEYLYSTYCTIYGK